MASVLALAALLLLATVCAAARRDPTQRTQRFDRDPGWEGVNNRLARANPRPVRQDFGYSRTGTAGAIGGFITPAAEPATFSRRIARRTLRDPLSASGTLACPGRKVHAMLGFFNRDTLGEWRTPNTIAIRLQGRGDVFYAYVEYATAKWRAGGDSPGGFATVRDPETGRTQFRGFAGGATKYRWSLRYDPDGNDGSGVITVTIGDQTSVCNLSLGHKADGAVFNRFGLMNVQKSVDSGGEIWLDDVTIDGRREDLSRDPGWESPWSRRTYQTTNVRPYADFGYSATCHAGGGTGEIGGQVFRGDCRRLTAMASYGDRLAELGLDKPLRAAGRVSLLRGVSDSTTLIGFYSSKASMASNPSQTSMLPKSFLGGAVEGPSREGFLFYPAYRLDGDTQGYAKGDDRPHILPDGSKHAWTLEYTPATAGQRGTIAVTLDGRASRVAVPDGPESATTRFDRFGIVTTWIDGNGQRIYFDDLTYTVRQQ